MVNLIYLHSFILSGHSCLTLYHTPIICCEHTDYVGDRRSGINTSVNEDVNSVFKDKTLAQLHLLEDSIKKKLRGGEGVDVGKPREISLCFY